MDSYDELLERLTKADETQLSAAVIESLEEMNGPKHHSGICSHVSSFYILYFWRFTLLVFGTNNRSRIAY